MKVMIAYRLPIAIEHALPDWSLVDFTKKLMAVGSVAGSNPYS